MNSRMNAVTWIKVCAESDLSPGNMLAVEPEGLPPIALFNVDGTFHATSNICTHNVAVLTDGAFSGCIVECPLHGGAFDVTTGEATSYPCEQALRIFPVAVVDGIVNVADALMAPVPAPDAAPAVLPTAVPAVMPAAAQTPAQQGAQPVITLAGSAQHFSVQPGDTLLQGALRAGIGFPYECLSGSCGSCVCELEQGAVDDMWPEAPGLSARARQSGRVLACQSVPRGDCVVRVRQQPRYIPPIPPARRPVSWDSIVALTPDMALLTFIGAGPAQFLPGQYALLRLAGNEQAGVRAYSMSNLPNPQGRWEFIIKRVPGGRLSPLLHGLQDPDTQVLLDGPYGTAFLQADAPRDIVCIAGGAGLSPMASILRGAASLPALSTRALHLFYGGRTAQDMCDAALIRDDPLLHGRVLLTSAISDAGQAAGVQWGGEIGFIHQVVARRMGAGLAAAEIYLSGPPAMVDAVQNMLVVEYRVPSSQIHFDRFG